MHVCLLQVGAFGFTPMTFIVPSWLWLVVRSPC